MSDVVLSFEQSKVWTVTKPTDAEVEQQSEFVKMLEKTFAEKPTEEMIKRCTYGRRT